MANKFALLYGDKPPAVANIHIQCLSVKVQPNFDRRSKLQQTNAAKISANRRHKQTEHKEKNYIFFALSLICTNFDTRNYFKTKTI